VYHCAENRCLEVRPTTSPETSVELKLEKANISARYDRREREES
jgi:hypothetical protein